MRLVCHLPKIRGDRTLSDISPSSGVHRGTLSRLEAGQQLALEKHVPALEEAYGAKVDAWYSRLALLAIQEDDAA